MSPKFWVKLYYNVNLHYIVQCNPPPYPSCTNPPPPLLPLLYKPPPAPPTPPVQEFVYSPEPGILKHKNIFKIIK